VTKVVALDDISHAMFKKLKTHSDSLRKLQSAIRFKKKEVATLTEEWLWLESEELDDCADKMYSSKVHAELQLQTLEEAEQKVLTRIKKHVN